MKDWKKWTKTDWQKWAASFNGKIPNILTKKPDATKQKRYTFSTMSVISWRSFPSKGFMTMAVRNAMGPVTPSV